MFQHHAASKLDRRQTNRIPQNWDGLLQESAASMGQIPKSQFFRWFKTYKSVQELAVSTGCKSKIHHLGMVGIPLIKNRDVLTLGWFMALIPHYWLHHSRTRSPWRPLCPLGAPDITRLWGCPGPFSIWSGRRCAAPTFHLPTQGGVHPRHRKGL